MIYKVTTACGIYQIGLAKFIISLTTTKDDVGVNFLSCPIELKLPGDSDGLDLPYCFIAYELFVVSFGAKQLHHLSRLALFDYDPWKSCLHYYKVCPVEDASLPFLSCSTYSNSKPMR